LFGAPARPRPPDTPEIRQSKVKEIRTAIERGCYMTEEKLDQTVDRLLALLMGDRI
jgi:anti-sigma28 factor (negative regulator of flagellin synthesis)